MNSSDTGPPALVADWREADAAGRAASIAARSGPWIAVIGGGPAGLMAAEVIIQAGWPVELFDRMPSVGRKFLLAGKGGLNLTHGEDLSLLLARYGARAPQLTPLIQSFGPQALRNWAAELGIETFVGSSGRVFPRDLKAAPLLRAWLHRLRGQGVRFHMRHRWLGFEADGALRIAAPSGEEVLHPAATVLALGGASWPQLGSDGSWVDALRGQGVAVDELLPSNCGFDVAWSEHFRERFAGQPVKSVAIAEDADSTPGEFVITAGGVEGSLIYAHSMFLRNRIARDGGAEFHLDLLPARPLDWVQREVAHPRGARSLSTHLKTRLNLAGVKAGLVWECVPRAAWSDPDQLAEAIKSLPIRVLAARPVAEAISSAGGVRFESLDAALMLTDLPGVFCAGEMLDWEAPTGGYLLTASLATGRAAGQGAVRWLAQAIERHPQGG